jgi:hypothetical protein
LKVLGVNPSMGLRLGDEDVLMSDFVKLDIQETFSFLVRSGNYNIVSE